MTIRKTCPICGKLNIVEVSEASYMKWEEGALIQEAFPEKSAAEREVIKTGICPECWDKMFEQEKEDDNDKGLRELIASLKDAKVKEDNNVIVVKLTDRQEHNKLRRYVFDNGYEYEIERLNLFKTDIFVTTITLKGD